MADPVATRRRPRRVAFWLVLLAAGGTLRGDDGRAAVDGPVPQRRINTTTGLGLASISLRRSRVGQLWWGLTQPFAGIAGRPRRRRAGAVRSAVLLVAIGTALVPLMTDDAGPDLRHRRARRRRRRHRRAVGADGRDRAARRRRSSAAWPPASSTPAARSASSCSRRSRRASPPAAAGLAALQSMAAIAAAGPAGGLAAARHRPQRRHRRRRSRPRGEARGAPRRDRPGASHDRATGCSRAGFFVCGFHVAFIATHLPGVVAACQLPPTVGAWSLAHRSACSTSSAAWRWAGRSAAGAMKSLLRWCTAARARRGAACSCSRRRPKPVVLVFAAVIGLTYLSTVPPTAGLVAKFFGTAHMATLFGFVMLAHQIGGFLGAWLGGKAFECDRQLRLDVVRRHRATPSARR